MLARKAPTDVIAASDDVQASLPPMRIVTYWTCWATALAACPGMSAALAPERASLNACPFSAWFFARMRR